MDVQISETDIINEFQRLFPLEMRVAVLTATNRRQSDVIAEQREIIVGQRAEANDEVWKRDKE